MNERQRLSELDHAPCLEVLLYDGYERCTQTKSGKTKRTGEWQQPGVRVLLRVGFPIDTDNPGRLRAMGEFLNACASTLEERQREWHATQEVQGSLMDVVPTRPVERVETGGRL